MDKKQALDSIKAVFDDQCAEINGREYVFTKTNHKKRIKVWSFLTKIQQMIEVGDQSFLAWDEFEKIEKLICDMVLFEDMQLSKISNHWDTYPEDYLTFIMLAMQVVCYPLYRGVV